jgi:CRP-like cAMP-binding protein
MVSNETLAKVQIICKGSSCGYRQSSDLLFLISATREIKLFKDLSLKQGEPAHASCCQYLVYEFIPAGQYVFKYGEIGSKFYILISGTVGIEIPVSDSGQITFTEIMVFHSGSSFGELALETSRPRSASAICKSDSHFLVLLKKDYCHLMQKLVTEKKNEMIYFLQSLPAFQKLNKLAISKLTYNIREMNYFKGQTVFNEGDPAKEIFIIHDGECKLSKGILKPGTSSGIRKVNLKRMHTAKRIGKGSMIGEDDVFNKNPHSYSCICSSDTLSLYVIPAVDFFVRITAEQPLKYLKSVSKAKKKFLDNWSSFRNSLDNLLERNPSFKPYKKEKSCINIFEKFSNIDKLNHAVTERKKIMSRASPSQFEGLWGGQGRFLNIEAVKHLKKTSADFILADGTNVQALQKNRSAENLDMRKTGFQPASMRASPVPPMSQMLKSRCHKRRSSTILSSKIF